jgi:FkbM family methyltransferase
MSIRKRLRLSLNARFFLKSIDGVVFLLDIKNRVDRHIDVSNRYEAEQVKYLLNLFKSNACTVFCDVGSHWGYYSLLVAKQTELKEMQIHAFEPDKINRYQLCANLFLNKLEHMVNVHDCGISNSDGKVSFHSFNEGNRGRSHISADGENVIEVRRLDDILSLKDKVIGIKIDVEGHESNAVKGMMQLLKNNKCIMQVESFESALPELTELMQASGYKHINCIEDDHYFSNISGL